jgi:prolyl-tRNA editing enzyme YbaK/EbsC (Cys-tRNA(Pro) deacylase)
MPVYCEGSIAESDRIYINGGKRGFIISMAAADMLRVLAPRLVSVATE